jgi:hypothetical protein
MTLQEFVRDSLLQISEGVADARHKNPGIAPHAIPANKQTDSTLFTLDASTAYPVEFDVAVTVNEKSSGGVSGGITVASLFKAEGRKGGASEHSTISRLKFSVPVVFTRHPDAG